LGNLILSGEAAPENHAVKGTQSGVTINPNFILMSDAKIGEFVFTSIENDGVVSYSPIVSVSLVNVSPVTDSRTALYTIPEPMDAIMVQSADETGKLILPASTEWVSVSSGT